jgi:hypothetical protein
LIKPEINKFGYCCKMKRSVEFHISWEWSHYSNF